ncbi:MAG: hypothetical protein COB93_02455 [Sneathiella sp.]|nr:MAG: hypothetical protein COB93_02455 [Sneathiella sp.]
MTDVAHDHNTKVSTDAVTAFQLSKLRRSKLEVDSTGNDHHTLTSELEASGLNMKAAKDALKIVKKGKVEATVSYLESLTRYLRILGCPLEKQQLDMFEHGTALQPIDEKAYDEGLLAGRMGDDEFDSPHELNSDSGREWARGYDVGQTERGRILAMEAEPSAELIKGDGDADNDDQTDIEDSVTAAE